MTARSFISDSSVNVLREAIGAIVDYGVFPGLMVRRTGATGLPEVCELERTELLEFYIAWPISFRLKTRGARYIWLALDAGDDTPGITEGIIAENPAEPRLGPCGWVSFSDGWKLPETDFDVRPAILHLWPDSPISRIEIHRIGAYCAAVVSHADGSKWAFYGEYDGDTFVSLSRRVSDALSAQSDESIVIT